MRGRQAGGGRLETGVESCQQRHRMTRQCTYAVMAVAVIAASPKAGASPARTGGGHSG